MTARQALAEARRILAGGGIEDAPLEAEVLLREALGKDRVQLYLSLDQPLSWPQGSALRDMMRRRLCQEPTAYILGRREFFGREFLVDPRVLVPRPETELLVEQALKLAAGRGPLTIADVGTGCGAIAISLVLELPQTAVYATDISRPALEVARANCRKHGVAGRVHIIAGDLLQPLAEPVDIIVANLPYIPRAELPLTGPVSREPRLALDGGPDGLAQIRRLASQAGAHLRPAGSLLLEVGAGQAAAVVAMLRRLLPEARIEAVADLAGIDRVVIARLPW